MRSVFRTRSKIKIERFGKEIIIFNYFCKKIQERLWEGSEHVSGFKYVRVLDVSKFLLKWQGSEFVLGCNYGKVLNIPSPGFRVCQVSAYASVAQGSEYAWIWLKAGFWRFVELGHFYKDFIKNTRKRGPAGNHFAVFPPRYS